jgi:hypothetical protein
MKRALRRTRLVGALAAGFVLGCASESLVQDRTGGSDQELAVSKVAVVTFQAAPRPGAEPLPGDATALVASYVADAFASRGIDTVPPSDDDQAIGSETTGASAVRQAAEHFGAGAVAVGTVYKFRDRSGEALGSTKPASVGFEVKLFTADGRLFGSKVFDHTQVALSENALTAAQYPGGGTRWLTAEELAHWGASELVKSFRLTSR